MHLTYAHTGIAAAGHLSALVARQMDQLGVSHSGDLVKQPHGVGIRVGGVVVARQTPPTAGGIAFLAIEDEEGLINIILPPEVVANYREALREQFLVIHGRVQRHGAAVSVVGDHLLPLVP